MGRYFANGTEWSAWEHNWCCRCLVDAFERANPGSGRGCPLITKAWCYPDEVIPEWIEQEGFRLGDNVHCVNFKPYGWRNPEPKPKPPPPNQPTLFEPQSGTRMYKDVVAAELTEVDA